MAMGMPPRQAPSMEQFEAYFQRADLDRDGRISGAEAVAFFQGANLPNNVLAQIWAYSDRTKSGFLSREEFYNALRLVTVAQTGRGLTREIVMAALEGPAAARIPPPQIRSIVTPNHPGNLSTPKPQLSSTMPSPVTVTGAGTGTGSVAASSAQNIAFRGPQGQVLPTTSTNQRGISSSVTTGILQATLPPVPVQPVPQGLPGGGSLAGSGNPNTNVANTSTDWLSAQPIGNTTGGISHVVSKVVTSTMKQDVFGSAPLSTALVPVATANQSNIATPLSSSLQHMNKDAHALVHAGNGFSSNSIFGGDMFAVAQPQGKPIVSSTTAAIQPSTVAVKPVASSNTSAGLAAGTQQTQPLFKQDQPNSLPHTFVPAPAGIPTPGSSTTQSQWRKMTHSDIQRYTKIFVEVDKDRDGKITGEEARDLFLSWRLQREILKQVWDLSDQDSDGMLSMREFCIALYLLERIREGTPLPAALPNSIKFDEVLLQATSHPVANYGGQTWQPSPGFHQPQSRPATAVKAPPQTQMPSQSVDHMQPAKQKSAVPVLEKQLVDQLSNEEQATLNAKLKEATDADKKVQELEKEIMDYKEKNEFYRTKMQELVLYKSRCDTRLNEVIERASADKRELELLSKKYEEKCKLKGDVASKLTIEEATFRDIQERKLEIYKAVAKLNQDGSTDGSLQSAAEKVQSDLEDLVRTLNDQCKMYGLRTKPTTLVELPFGWQPGIQEGSADWDESWDKFDDEGFMLVKDLTIDVENIIAKPKSKHPTASDDTRLSKKELSSAASAGATDVVEKAEKPSSQEDIDSELVFSQSEDAKSPKQSSPRKEALESLSPKFDAKSPKRNSSRKEAFEIASPKFDANKEDELLKSPPQSSPGKSMSGSPSQNFSMTRFGLNDTSPRVSDQRRGQEVAETNMIGDNHNDTSLWGPSFDRQDDSESIWGFESIDQGVGHDRGYDSFFGSGDFGLNPIKTETPSAAGQYKPSSIFGDSVPATPQYKPSSIFADSVPATPQYKPSSVFADSVPATPQYSSSFSPRYSDRLESFDSFGPFGRFDSFSNPTSLTRFDSMRSSTSEVSGFFTQNDSQLARFDSIRSTSDSEAGRGFTSFDEADPFGTGPFKSSGTDTPKQTYDNWRAF